MRPDFPGGYPPGGRGRRRRGEPLEPYERLIAYGGGRFEPSERLITYSGGGRRRRKKNGWLKHIGDVLLWLFIGLLIFVAVESVPYLLEFDPCDIMDYSNADIFGKVDALRDGLRHKRGISEIKFSHDGKTVTLIDEKGTLTDISGEGYSEGDEGEFQRDVDEARRLLREWGLD